MDPDIANVFVAACGVVTAIATLIYTWITIGGGRK